MDKNGVPHREASSTAVYTPADIADRARAFTVFIECWG
jgi:hypothetical protein